LLWSGGICNAGNKIAEARAPAELKKEYKMSDIQKGDVVQLKSGGPVMTVKELGDYSESIVGIKDGVRCVWFDGQKPQEKVFDLSTLGGFKFQVQR